MKAAVLLVAAALCASPAFAQAQPPPPPDGKATLSGIAAEQFNKTIAAGGFKTKETMRDWIRIVMADGIQPDERDFANELGAGAAVAVAVGATATTVEPLPPEAVKLAQTFANIPNLHTLWHADPEHTETMIEIARWGDLAKNRIIIYIGNQLDDAWKASTMLNAYAPYVGAIGNEWNSMKALPDRDSRELAYDLISYGVSYGIEKAKGESREPPQPFLYEWIIDPNLKKSFIERN